MKWIIFLLAVALVSAIDLQIMDSEFSCPPTYQYCSMSGTDLYWGVPVDGCDVYILGSGIQFQPNTSIIHIDECGTNNINLGVLRSRNAIIASDPGAPSSVDLKFDLVIDGVQTVPITIRVEIDETDNTEPCAYSSTVPCADRHIYRILTPSWTTNGLTYELSFAGSDTFTVIIQENCAYKNPTDIFTDPITLIVDINVVKCCPIAISVEPFAAMYLPWQINLTYNSDCMCPNTDIGSGIVYGRVVIMKDGMLIKTVMDPVEVLLNSVFTIVWKPHNMYPGRYQVVFQLQTLTTVCNEANFWLNVRPPAVPIV